MSDLPRQLRDVFVANDTSGDLRSTVIRHRQASDRDGGGGDGLEPRVAKLEAGVEHIQKDMTDLKADMREFRADIRETRERLARLEEKVAHLPGKGFIVASLLVSVAVITGLLAFQGQIQTFARLPVTATAPAAN